MKSRNLRKIVLSALLAALTAVATIVFVFPLPGNGYVNLGDCFVIISAFILGPVWGGLAAGLGAAISDLILGYAIYAPATFVIKFLMAFVAALIIKKSASSTSFKAKALTVISAITAEAIMIIGYFIYEIFLYDFGIALIDIAGNSIQAGIAVVSSMLLYAVLVKTKVFSIIQKAVKS